jgi:hypothetical protein
LSQKVRPVFELFLEVSEGRRDHRPVLIDDPNAAPAELILDCNFRGSPALDKHRLRRHRMKPEPTTTDYPLGSQYFAVAQTNAPTPAAQVYAPRYELDD